MVNCQYNYSLSLDPSAYAAHRKRTPAQQQLEQSLLKHKALGAREMGDIIRDASTDPSFFRKRDIYNDRQRLREVSLGGKTATQAWIGYLESDQLKYIVKYDAEGKVEAIFWIYPWCECMWKRFPEVLGLDNIYKTNCFKMYLF